MKTQLPQNSKIHLYIMVKKPSNQHLMALGEAWISTTIS